MLYEIVKRVCSLLERSVEKTVDSNIYYGKYPHILLYNDKLYTFYEDGNQRNFVTSDWACSVGIPIGIRERVYDKDVDTYVGYIIGNRIFIHSSRLPESTRDVNLVIPTQTRIADITPPAWNGSVEELADYVMKNALFGSPDFLTTMLNVPLSSSCVVDIDSLYRDGWIVNQLFAKQTFVGIRRSDILMGGEIAWSNRYFVNVCKDRGNTVTGMVFYDAHPHPHVDVNFKLCTNEWEGMFLTRMQRGDYTQVFYLMTDFLNAFSSSSPYFDLPIQDANIGRLNGSKYFKNRIEVFYRGNDEDRYEDEDVY